MCMANLPYHHCHTGSPEQVWFDLNHSRSLTVHNSLLTESIFWIQNIGKIFAKPPTFSDFCSLWQAVCSNAPELSVVGDLGDLKDYGSCRCPTSSAEILVDQHPLITKAMVEWWITWDEKSGVLFAADDLKGLQWISLDKSNLMYILYIRQQDHCTKLSLIQ